MPDALEQEKPSNVIVWKATHKKHHKTFKDIELPKGIVIGYGGKFSINTQVNGERFRASGFDTLKEAKNALDKKHSELVTGVKVFENQATEPKQEILFRDFALVAMEARAGKHGYSLADAKVFMKGNQTEIDGLKKEVEISHRFNFGATYNYFGRFKKVFDYFAKIPVKDIRPVDVTRYLSKYPVGNTRKNEGATINGIWNFSLDMGVFDGMGITNPYRKGLHKPKKTADPIIHFWGIEERKRFLQSAKEIGTDLFFPFQLLMDMSEFGWLVGGRIDAFLSLQVSQIKMDEGNGTIHFQGHKLKGARYIVQHFKFERAKEIARKYMNGKKASDCLFTWDGCHKRKNQGNQVEYYSLRRAFVLVCEKAGITEGANFHSLKKTYGMERAINGASPYEVQQELQHKNYATTEKHYLDNGTITEETSRRLKLPQAEQDRLRQGYTP